MPENFSIRAEDWKVYAAFIDTQYMRSREPVLALLLRLGVSLEQLQRAVTSYQRGERPPVNPEE